MRRKYLWLFALGVAPLATLACANILGFERLEAAVVDGGASSDTGMEPPKDAPPPLSDAGSDTAAPGNCPEDGIGPTPAEPGGDAGPVNPDDTVRFAFDTVAFGSSSSALFNLDGRCTTDEASSACRLRRETLDRTLAWQDQDGGGDNASALLLTQLLGSFAEVKPERFNIQLRAGAYGIGVILIGYNGLRDDASVSVYLQPFVRVEGYRADGTPVADGAPGFSDKDNWRVDDEWKGPGKGYTKFGASVAFVRDGTLFARFTDFKVRIPVSNVSGTPPLLLSLSAVRLRADISLNDAGTGYSLGRGVLAGSWPRESLLRTVGALKLQQVDSNGKTPLCSEAGYTLAVKSQVCASLDLPVVGTAACDAMSTVMSFSAYQVANSADTSPAPDAGPEPCTDASAFQCPCDPDAGETCP